MARTDGLWKKVDELYIKPHSSDLGILLEGSDLYLNFGSDYGSSGYGFRDNSGTMEFKDSGGSWTSFGTGGGSGDVVGPASAVDGNIATFDSTTGKLIQDSSVAVDDVVTAGSNVVDNTLVVGDGGSKGVKDSTITVTNDDELGGIEHATFNSISAPTHSEGLAFYDSSAKALSYYNDESDITMNIGFEDWIRVYNDSGSAITNGQAVYISGYDSGSGLPEIDLTETNDNQKARFAGLATHDIENGSIGYITNFGQVNEMDTSSFSAGVVLYLDPDTAGSLTDTRPEAPNYIVPVGVTVNSHASTGSVIVGATAVHGGNSRIAEKFWNGSIVEDIDVDVTSNGTVISLSLQKNGGGDLTLLLNQARETFDCTPAATVSLTAGSDSSPQINYVYILASNSTLTASTTSFPDAQHVPIATVLCQTAASLQTDGAMKVHTWNDHLSDSNDQGHLSHLNKWIRNQNATWESGVAITPTVGASTFEVATSSGVVDQLHEHDFPAFDTSTGSELYMVNYPSDAYKKALDLTQTYVDVDANGTTLGNSGTDFYNLVIWGVVSENSSECKLMINLPDGAYNNNSGGKAENDDDNTAVYAIPSEFRGTGFLIARLTVRENGGTYTIEKNTDLRGQFPSQSAGGGSAGGSEFADNVFRIQDEGDTTKEIAFQASGITTATTRTVTMPDEDVDLTNVGLNTTHRGSDGSDHTFIDQDVTSGASPTFGTANMTDATDKRFMTDSQETVLDSVETNADVTDEANVVSSLDGATLTAVTVAGTDKVLVQDASDADNLKTVTAQSIADLAPVTPGGSDTQIQYNNGGVLGGNSGLTFNDSSGDFNVGGVLYVEGTGLDVGINTTTPVSYLDINALTSDPLTDLSNVNLYAARYRRNDNTNGTGVGVAFTVSTAGADQVGAAIVHERNGSNSMGDLIFYTKQVTTGGADPVEVLRLGDDGNSTFAGNIVVSGTVDGRDVAADGTKLDLVEDNADVTDEANVTDALDGATLTDLGTPAAGDLILLQDASDSNNLKVAQFSEFGGSGGGQETYDIIVAPSGGDYTTLGAALAAASNNDRILVKNGTYTESALSTSLTGLTIIGQNKEGVDIQILANDWTFSGSGLTFSNMKITYTSGDFNVGGANSLVTGCHFYANTTASTGYLYVNGARSTVSENYFESQSSSTSSTAYIVYFNAEHLSFINNTVYTQVRSLSVIKVNGTWTVITGNRFQYYGTGSSTTDIIDVASGFKEANISNNILDLRDATNEPNGITVQANNSVVSGNVISGGAAKCITIGAGGSVIGNTMKQYSDTGVWVIGANSTVTGNYFGGLSTTNTEGILTSSGGDNLIVSGNAFQTLNIGISLVSGANNCSVGLNNFSNVTTDISDAASGTGYLIGSVVEDTTPQLGGDLDINEKYIEFDPSPSSDHTGNGIMATVTVDSNSVGIGAILYIASDGNYEPALADDLSTFMGVALAMETGTGSKKVLLQGYFRDDTWDWDVGEPIYVAWDSAGGMTQDALDIIDNDGITCCVGYAVSADIMYFTPSPAPLEGVIVGGGP